MVEVRTARTFTIATGSRDAFPIVVVVLEHGDHVGLGEASPSKRVTGEDVKSIGQFLDWAAGEVKDLRPAQWASFLDQMHAHIRGNNGARNAVDLAMHDLVGKLQGVPARALYGIPEKRLETSMTIPLDTPAAMAALAMDYQMRGFRCLKLKLGRADEDVARVEAVRRVAPEAHLRADANTGWTAEESYEILPQLVKLGVEFVEQPVPVDQTKTLAELSQWSPIPIYADEAVLDVHDVERLAAAGFRGGVNLKLQKTGGLRPAVHAARVAREKGYWVQLGCNIETSIGISGALQMLGLLDHADLDGNLLLAEDPYVGPVPVEGWYESPTAPGLGVGPRL